jgi:hypothetical protein
MACLVIHDEGVAALFGVIVREGARSSTPRPPWTSLPSLEYRIAGLRGR